MTIVQGKRPAARRSGRVPDPVLTLADFSGAPPGAVVSPEGWLLFRDEAWTVEEWRAETTWRPSGRPAHRPRVLSDEERLQRKRAYDREYARRRSAAS